MKTVFALALACLLFTHDLPMADADDNYPPAVEYILLPDGAAMPRAEWGGDFIEQIEIVGQGDRADAWTTGVATPSLTVYPTSGTPIAACVVCPGGGYGGLSVTKEGTFVAEWLRERGVAAGVLKYPVQAGNTPLGQAYLGDAPLRSVQTAIRFLKQKTGVKVGVLGFSAGGHLAACAANLVVGASHWARNDPAAHSSEVAFQALIYPVISMQPGITHGGSRENLLGKEATAEQLAKWSMENRVSERTPPAFIVAAADDATVPVENSLRYFEACQAKRVPAELHIYPSGGHGYGMWSNEGTIATWPTAFDAWLKSLGFVDAGE
ncbi:MAG: alpha/beta hydrolase [Planctomycetota bacterium]